MQLFSLEWWWIFVIVCLVLWLRMRRGRGERPSLVQRQILVKGKKMLTSITPQTPLECLLDEGIKFGSGYQIKQGPALPHTEGCSCTSVDISYHSSEWWQGKSAKEASSLCDLSELSHQEFRYYKYRLILAKMPKDHARYKEFESLCDLLDMSQAFKRRIEDHLKQL